MSRFGRMREEWAGNRRSSSADASVSGRAQIDPATVMRLRNLELRARAVVEGFMAGIHRSPWHGFSVEFTDYRQYSPGDDPRYLDWKLYARQDRYYIKRYEDETNLRCHLVADLSRSMEYGSLQWTKADYARTLLATLACFLSFQHDACGLVTFDESVRDYVPARYRPGHLRRIMVGLERATGGSRSDIAPSLDHVARLTRGRGMVVLVSDFLAELDDLSRNLGYLRSQGHEVMLFRVLDPREVSFDFDDPGIFEDLESGKELFVDPATIQREYRRRFAEHATGLQDLCRAQSAELVTLTTDQPLQHALADFVHQRRQLAARSTRRRRSRGRASGSRSGS